MKRTLPRRWAVGLGLGLLSALLVLPGCKWKRGALDNGASVLAFDLTQHVFEAERIFTSYRDGLPECYTERVLCLGDGHSYQIDLLEVNGVARMNRGQTACGRLTRSIAMVYESTACS